MTAGTGARAGAATEAEAPRRIVVLDSLVADQIAAGEVIERPASVVKELVENALDAGAREVAVELVDGGRERISVRDDGCGMLPDDAERACLRHATSKLRHIDDLASIGTHGFRGEALASIAAVAEVVLSTRARGEDAGVRLVVRGGAVLESSPAGVPVGTTIEVRGLFSMLPARRKFLKAAATETSHITDSLQRLALVRPGVGFLCAQGGREILRYPPVSRADERLRQVLGAPRARSMVAVRGDEPGVSIEGYISRAGESVAQAKGVLTYVNGRLVRDRVLLRAVLDAYRSLLPQGRYPVAVLALELPGSLVDVNVHPTKTEVRFAQGDAVYGAVLRALRTALADGVTVPGGVAPPRSPGEPSGGAAPALEQRAVSPAMAAGFRVEEALRRYGARSESQATARAGHEPGLFAPPGDSSPVRPSPATAPAAEAPRFADLRVIGQAFGGFIVCEGSDALVLVDQHAAHERVRFERLRASRSAGGESRSAAQQLLVPRVVELEGPACATLLGAGEILRAAGFEVEAFGDRAVVVRSIPASLDVATDPEVLLAEIARDLAEAGFSERSAAARDALLARIACHGAVRSGDGLAPAEMSAILADLDTVPFAATCPHGRPLLIEIPRAELARRVRRS